MQIQRESQKLNTLRRKDQIRELFVGVKMKEIKWVMFEFHLKAEQELRKLLRLQKQHIPSKK